MKKIFFFLLMLAMSVACNIVEVESDFSQNGKESASGVKIITEIISGNHGYSTKATIADADASFKWTAGDKLAVHVSKGDSHMYVETSSGASQSEATAAFEVVYEEGFTRDAFAVYPSTLVKADATNYGQDNDHPLAVTLPGSYTLDKVSGTTTPCPMIATNSASSSSWEFFQLCGLLRLTVSGIHPNTKRLEIDFNGKKVWGDFSIASPVIPGTSEITPENEDDQNHDIITITKDGSDVTFNNKNWMDLLVLNIPLPTRGGPYSNITVTAYDALSAGTVLFTTTTTLPVSYTADREHGTKKFACFPVFSVSSTQRVIFAPGNLQATTSDLGDSWTWRFAEHQYDYIGDTEHNPNSINSQLTNVAGKTNANGTVDLFYRSLPENGFGITTKSEIDYYGASFVDWTGLSIDSNGPDYWRTLTESEWHFVVGKDEDCRYYVSPSKPDLPYARGTKAIINTDGTPVKGFILFPDYYPIPTAGEKVTEGNIDIIVWGAGINSTGTAGWNTTCTAAGWNYLESAGCVFLPAAGCRNESTLRQIGEFGHYKHATYWIRLRFDDSGYDPTESDGLAGSVRLVHSEGFRSFNKEGYTPVSY